MLSTERKIPTVSHLRRVLIAPMHMDPKQDKGLTKQQLRDSERPLHAGTVGAGRYGERFLPMSELPCTNFYPTDSLLGVRDLRRWTVQQLRSIQPGLHVHSGLIANPSLCACTHRLPSSTTWTEWTRGSRCTACPVWRPRTTSAPSTAATGSGDHLAAAPRDVLSKRTTSHGWCPAAPCVRHARSGKAAIPPLVRGMDETETRADVLMRRDTVAAQTRDSSTPIRPIWLP
jgi:hypothetical protein